MSRDFKKELLKNMSNEELLTQYDSSLRLSDEEILNVEYTEDVDLCRAEILRRMSK